LEDTQKAYALAAWEKRWTTYVQAIVALDGAF